MAGILHYEGQQYFGDGALKNTGVQATLYIGLLTNSTALTKDNTMANVTEVTGGGYARLPLSAVNWTLSGTKTANSGSLYSQPRQSWVFNTAIGNVTGYFITTTLTGTTGKLIASEMFPTVANVNQVGYEIRVTPQQEIR